jgi:hypothetical protein
MICRGYRGNRFKEKETLEGIVEENFLKKISKQPF